METMFGKGKSKMDSEPKITFGRDESCDLRAEVINHKFLNENSVSYLEGKRSLDTCTESQKKSHSKSDNYSLSAYCVPLSFVLLFFNIIYLFSTASVMKSQRFNSVQPSYRLSPVYGLLRIKCIFGSLPTNLCVSILNQRDVVDKERAKWGGTREEERDEVECVDVASCADSSQRADPPQKSQIATGLMTALTQSSRHEELT
jgi:hypothetical protein